MLRGLFEDDYDIQKVRIALSNEITAAKEDISEQEAIFIKESVLDRLNAIEKDMYKHMNKFIENVPIYTGWLKNIKGIGPALATGLVVLIGTQMSPHIEEVIIRRGPHKGEIRKLNKGYATISKLWRNSGLAVNGDGLAERRTTGESLHFSPRLKILMWKIGESFVKGGKGYRELYEQFRSDYDNKWKTAKDCGSKGCLSKKNKKPGMCMDGHRYMAAKRKTVKVFLAHYWMKARELEGLPVENPFIIGRNGHGHLIDIIEE